MKWLAKILIAYLLLAVPAAFAFSGPLDLAPDSACTMHEDGKASHEHEREAPDCCDQAGAPVQARDTGGKPCPCDPGVGCHAGTFTALPAPRLNLSGVTLAGNAPARHLLRPPLAVEARRWRPPALI